MKQQYPALFAVILQLCSVLIAKRTVSDFSCYICHQTFCQSSQPLPHAPSHQVCTLLLFHPSFKVSLLHRTPIWRGIRQIHAMCVFTLPLPVIPCVQCDSIFILFFTTPKDRNSVTAQVPSERRRDGEQRMWRCIQALWNIKRNTNFYYIIYGPRVSGKITNISSRFLCIVCFKQRKMASVALFLRNLWACETLEGLIVLFWVVLHQTLLCGKSIHLIKSAQCCS